MRDAVVARWGEEVAPGGVVDREQIARRAFADPAERAWLEGLPRPLVAQRVVRWREEVERRDPRPRAAVVETPLPFEAGMDGVYDATIALVADEAVRDARARLADTTRSTSAPRDSSRRPKNSAARHPPSATTELLTSSSPSWPSSLSE